MVNVVIYCITNKVTNQIYIGSAVNYKSRWRNHRNLLTRNRHYNTKLQNSWNFYGENNFLFDILEYVESKELLIEREQFYLNKILFASENDNRFIDLGFNILRNAGNSIGFKHSEETKEKFRGENNPMYGKQSFLGKKHSEESKKQISESKLGKSIGDKNHFFNKIHSKTSREKMSLNRKKLLGQENPNFGKESSTRRVVIQFDIEMNFIKEWSHAGEAAKSLKIIPQNITACCLNKLKTYKGFIWRYAHEKKEFDSEIIELYKTGLYTQRQICKMYKMSPNKVSCILRNVLFQQ